MVAVTAKSGDWLQLKCADNGDKTGTLLVTQSSVSSSSAPGPVTEGDPVQPWYDTNGRLHVVNDGALNPIDDVVATMPAVVGVTINPAVDTAAYASGNLLFAKTQINNLPFAETYFAELTSLTLTDNANQKSAIDLLFFDDNPDIGATLNAVFSWGTTGFGMCVGRVRIDAADYVTIGSKAVATKVNLGLHMLTQGGRTLRVAAVSAGTPTYATATDLTIKFQFKRDA